MCCCIKGISPHWSFLQVESRETPDVFLKLCIHVRRQQIFKNGWAEWAVLEFCIQNTVAEFGGINAHYLTEIRRVNIFHLRWRNHQVIQNRIIQNCFLISVEDDAAVLINSFRE